MTILNILKQRAQTSPDRLCYSFVESIDAELNLSYGELDRAARAIAQNLLRRGVAGDRVLILMPSGLEFVQAFWGCLYAGMIAVPLYPPKANDASGKIPNIIIDCAPTLALIPDDLPVERIEELGAQGPQFVRFAEVMEHTGQAQQLADPALDAVAFLQYSSGSTGNPKGVMISYRNIASNMSVIEAETGSSERDVFVGWLPLFHDMGMVMIILLPVFHGARSIFFSPLKFAKTPLYWFQVLSRYRGTISGGPNFAYETCSKKFSLEALRDLDISSWRIASNGAEPVRAETITRFAELYAAIGFRKSAIMPTYGMAESVVFLCANQLDRFPTVLSVERDQAMGRAVAPSGEVRIDAMEVVSNGRPPAAHALFIVNEGQKMAERQVGEIWARGASISSGYWGKPELSQATFGARTSDGDGPFLRTGDLGFFADGELFILGRLKDVLIIQGRNLYPQDLEACARHALPSQAAGDGAVFGVEGGATEQLVLVQEIRPRFCERSYSELAADVRAALFASFGVLVLSVVFVPVGAVLKTTSGKVMRAQMRLRHAHGDLVPIHVDTLDFAPAEFVPLNTPTELRLAQLWEHLLGVSQVHAGSSFIQLGGDSMTLARMIEEIRGHWNVALPLRQAFECSTLAELACAIERASQSPATASLAPAGQQRAPLSFAQQRLWFLTQFGNQAGATENVGLSLHLEGKLDCAALEMALSAIVARHEVLRSRFLADVSGDAVQVVMPARPFVIRHADLTTAEPERSADALHRIAQHEVNARFDLNGDVLLRACLVRQGESRQVLLLTMHHIASDGWSAGVLIKELSALYSAHAQGHAPALAPLPLQYRDYAVWQKQHAEHTHFEQSIHYWQDHLRGIPAVHALPLDVPRGVKPGFAGAAVKSKCDAATSLAFKKLCMEQGATLFMGLHALFSVLASRYSRERTVVVGTAVANREQAALFDLIGLFVNTVVLRSDIDGQDSFRDVLAQSRQAALAAFEHQSCPFEKVVESVAPVRQPHVAPLFQLMLILQNSEFPTPQLAGLEVAAVEEIDTFAKLDLVLGVRESAAGLELTWTYNANLFHCATIEQLAASMEHLMGAVLAAPDRTVASLPLLGGRDAARQLSAFNDTRSAYQETASIHALFEAQCASTPEAVALVYEDLQLSYEQLNARANRLAHHLRAQGVGADSLVGLCVERGADMIVCLLAILKAGGAYVALDPVYPSERLAYMVEDSAMRLLLTHESARAKAERIVQGQDAVCINIDDAQLLVALDASPTANPAPTAGADARSLAYVIYTSGSTGQPKGVMVEHRNVVNHMQHHIRQCQLTAADRVMQFASISFDASVEEIFPTLCVGATLVVRPAHLVAPDAQFARFLAQHAITIADLPTAFWHQWAEQVGVGEAPWNEELRLVVVGGEKAEARHLRSFRAGAGRAPVLVNTYGPTEATIYATSIACGDAMPDGDIPIGRPIANTRIYVLDEALEPVPLGVVGEIWIAGAGVARGYLHQPELSSQRFVADRFDADRSDSAAGARMYRSGDLGRWRADGTLEYMGRNDHQVKIRGFRIELGEIEARLAACAGVRDAVVLARPTDSGDLRLVAYVVAAPQAAMTAGALQEQLQAVLPEYMVPAFYVLLDALPLTPNGKVDRKALPEPVASCRSKGDEPPATATEKQVAALWAQLLDLPAEAIGATDNFFALGGHSMLVVRLLSSLRHAGLHTDVATVYEAPTLRALAASLDAGGSSSTATFTVCANGIAPGCEHITPSMLPLVDLDEEHIARIVSTVPGGAANVQDIYPLAPLQEGIYFYHLMHKETDPYVLPVLLSVENKERFDKLVAALQQVIDRHDALRTAVLSDGLPLPVQVVYRHAELKPMYFTLDPARDAQAQLRQQLADPQALDVACAPMLSVQAASDPSSERIFVVLRLHHLVADASSALIMEREVRACLAGQQEQLQPAVPYREFVARALRQEQMPAAQAYFTRILAGVRSPTAPFNLLDVHGDGAEIVAAAAEVEADLAVRIRQCAREYGCSPAALFHAAWALVVKACAATNDPVFGTVLAGRLQGTADMQDMLGNFINTLPLRVQMDGASVAQLLAQTEAGLRELLVHEQTPLTIAQRCSELDARTPLFSAMFNYRHAAPAANPEVASDGVTVLDALDRATYPFVGIVDDLGQGFSLGVQVHRKADAGRVLGYFRQALSALVAALECEPQLAALDIPVLPPHEQQAVLHDFNATRAEYPRELAVHELVEAQAGATPERIALVFEERQFSYAQLNEGANQLAHYLREQGVGAGSLVGLYLERGPHMLIGALAICKAGGAYMPLDPAYPQERLRHMVQDSGARLVLTDAAQLARAGQLGSGLQLVCLDSLRGTLEDYPRTSLPSVGAQTAYVIYTSGSTGLPKGVVVRHQGLCNFLHSMREMPGLQADDVLLAVTSLSFDIAALELYLPLIVGARVVLASQGAAREPRQLRQLIERHGVSVMQATPSTWRMLLESGWPEQGRALKVLCGGEALPQDLAQALLQQVPAVWNMYGPTETTIWSTVHCLTRAAARPLLGRPIANTQVYVLNDRLQPVPLGVAGHLYIGGDGLAQGYLNRPELTAERFIANPFGQGRLYHTGDLVRQLADGTLDYLGRSDDQVKIRGHRIELGEIESRLADHAAVSAAVVVARADGAGVARLVAYVTAQPGAEADGALVDSLKADLAASLPEYMVPAQIMVLPDMPLTANGKIDRKALPAPDALLLQAEYVAPQTAAEVALASIWSDLLQLPATRIGTGADFFTLGGHSLLAIRLVAEVRRRLDLEISIKDVFSHSVLADLAARLDRCGASSARPAVVALPRDGRRLPLSFAQQRLWVLDQMDGGNAHYNMPAALRVRGSIDVGLAEQAFRQIIARHEPLRTVIASDGEGAWQVIRDKVDFAITRVDLRHLPAQEREQVARELAAADVASSFDLANDLMLRVSAIQTEADECILLFNMHHIASDGWSMDLLVKEFIGRYEALKQGGTDPYAPLTIQYGDFAHWQRNWLQGEELERQFGYWSRQLAGLPAVHGLPLDHPRPAKESTRGARHYFAVDQATQQGLARLARERHATVFMVLHSAISILLARHSGSHDIVIGTPVANRLQKELEDIIGCFANTLVLRADCSGNPRFVDFLEHIKGVSLDAQAHQDMSFDYLVERLKPARSTQYSPMFQILFSMGVIREEGPVKVALDDVEFSELAEADLSAKYELTFDASETAEGLAFHIEYNRDLFDAATMARMAEQFVMLLRGIVAAPYTPIMSLPLLDEPARRQLIDGFNSTRTGYAESACIHALFEAQCASTPEAVALVYEDLQLSYEQLNARANRLAHHLRAQGVGADSLVGLCVERGADMIVCLLAILKAGGAYVALDPVYPTERLAYMVEDSAMRLLLTHESARAKAERIVQGQDAVCINIDDAQLLVALDASPTANPAPAAGASASSLAYVIYTSGSTGQPKGVMVEHRNVVNHMQHHIRQCQLTAADRVMQFASISFDASVEEIFPTLCVGAALVVRPAYLVAPDAQFTRFLARHAITIADLPTAFWHQWAEQVGVGEAPWNEELRLVVVGGEKAEARHLRSFRAGAGCAPVLVNTYGPTEATIYATSIACGDAMLEGEIPIGRPIANTRIYVLDEAREPVPLGVVGEIYIAGAGVARGYLHQPELSSQRFVADRFDSAAGARMYRSGDLGRWRADGTLEYMGRNDHQVKIRGFRIELGEIEARLAACAGVRDAVVLARPTDTGDLRLVAYVVAAPQALLTASVLQEQLQAVLPEYMVPAFYVMLDALPLTPNGKVDRNALPEPELGGQRAYQAAGTPTEQKLVEIWAKLLRADASRIGISDDFFALGGHSLLLVQLTRQVKTTFQVELSVRDSLSDANIHMMAKAIDALDRKNKLAQELSSLPGSQIEEAEF